MLNNKINKIIQILEKALNIQNPLKAQFLKKYKNLLKCKNIWGDPLEWLTV